LERAVEAAAELAEVVVGFFMIDFLTEADLGIEPSAVEFLELVPPVRSIVLL